LRFPEDLKYTKDHEWIRLTSGNTAEVGVTGYAIEQLGDIVHVDLPNPGAELKSGASFGTIESTKTVSDLYMPVSGKVGNVNSEIVKSPEKLQSDPYTSGWLLKIEVSSTLAEGSLMTARQYEDYLKNG
jgi:glycine cleavage system H protein